MSASIQTTLFEITETNGETVAEYENASPKNLPPLPGKINSGIFHQLTATDCEFTEPVEFMYLWYEITVQPDGEVTITP